MPMENLRINTLLFKFPNPEHNTFDGFQSVKKEYTNEVLKFFRVRNYLAATNFVGDVEVYIKVKDENYNNTRFVLFNRFYLKLNYNHIYNQPELVVSYGRTMRLCKYSLQKLSTIYANNYNQLQYADNVASPLQLVNKVLHSYRLDPEGNSVHLRIRTLKGIEKDQNENPQAPSIDKKTLFPIVNRSLQAFFGIPVNDDSYRNRNRYTRYLTEINNFIQKYLNEDFRKIIPIQDQFTQVEPYAISPTKADLLFGSSYHNNIPRQGLNNGTYQQPSANDVVLFFIYPENFRQSTLTKLYNYFTNECGTREPKYKGLIQYIGITAHGIGKFSITYNPNNSNAADEIARCIANELFEDELAFDGEDSYFKVTVSKTGTVVEAYNISNAEEHIHKVYEGLGISNYTPAGGGGGAVQWTVTSTELRCKSKNTCSTASGDDGHGGSTMHQYVVEMDREGFISKNIFYAQ